ncbi:hypothetical protein ACJMK2_019411 [Sinanodonta woodiana]|uniref:Uncharacterized protein n=1 Tax=Sinanodonta woodiana TaxID=1069815 RepID=A0ABD3UJT4_SINWO
MDPRLPVGLIYLVYAISSIVFGDQKDLTSYGFQRAEEETHCNLSITHKSAEYLMVKFYQFDPDVAYLTLKFPNNSVIQFREDVIQPFRWMWTFESQDRKLPFPRWDLDYAVVSLGLLQEKTFPETWVEFDVQPPNCSITIGSRKSNLEIAYAFSNMTTTDLNSLGSMYDSKYAFSKNHSWCFVAEIPGVKDTYMYKLGIYLGSPVDFTQYNCCFAYYDFFNKEINVSCLNDKLDMAKSSTPGLFILPIIIFLCAPILILDFVSNRSGKDMQGSRGRMRFRNSYLPLDDIENNDNINYDENMTSDYVYLTKHSPITFTSIISKSCLQSKRHPIRASRLRRTIFIFLCPILIYIQLGIYSSKMRETILELIKHGAPINFLTMLGEFDTSRKLFLPYICGPYVWIFLFHLVGVLFVVLPENLEILIDDACPTTYGYDLVKRFSHVNTEEERGYRRLRLLMFARFCCILNYEFWLHVFHMYRARCQRCLACLRNILPTLLFYFIILIVAPILFVAFFIVLFLVLFIYGTPWSCLPLVVKQTGMLWMKWSQYLFDNICKSCASCCTVIFCLIIWFPSSLLFTYSILIIINNGIFFVTQIIVFLFTAVLVYPSMAFKYVFFGVSLFHYLLKQIGGISDDYFDLLSDVVKSIQVLEAEHNQLRVVEKTLIVPNGHIGTIQKIQINGTSIRFSKKQLQRIRTSSTHDNGRLIHYKNNVPGIPRKLFRYIVQKHRPVFIVVFKALLPIVLIGISMPHILAFISDISHDSSQLTEVMGVVFISFLPRIVEMAFSSSNKPALKEIFQKQLETSVLEYKNLVQT